MDSPFAPPDPPVEPPYRVPAMPGPSKPASWPIQPGGQPVDDSYDPSLTRAPDGPPDPAFAPPSVVMDTAVLPKRNTRRTLSIAVVACVLSAIVAFAIARATDSDEPRQSTSPATTSDPANNTPTATNTATPIGNPGAGVDVISVVAKIRPSVVKVAVDIVGGIQGTGAGVGTGVIITSDGEILTNAHVVEGADQVRIVLAGETEPIDAEVLGIDVGNDLALIKVDRTGLPAMVFADSDAVQVGQPVVAMGYALDLEGDVSVTSGIISALNRAMVTEDGALDRLLQTDAAISSGNSGGPLVDAAGEMIGINTAVARGDAANAANNIGFAISTKEIQRVVERLRTSGGTDQPEQGCLGVGVESRRDGGSGAIVNDVAADSPAASIGLEVGDVVTEVNGVPINGQAGLIAAIRDSAPGDEIEVVYSRDGDVESGTAALATRPCG